MRQIGVSAYRFPVSWPRVLPAGKGAVNAAGLAFYDRLIDRLLAARIQPWLCLYHWDLPQALQDLGGWANREIVGWYADYAHLIAQRFGDQVKHVATFNEPFVFSLFGYAFGWHPPASSDRASHFKAIHYINLAHGASVDALRNHVKDALIGCVNNIQPSGAVAPYLSVLAQLIEPYQREGDMARICRPVDWLGVNHYSPIYAKAASDSALGFACADAPRSPHRVADRPRCIPRHVARGSCPVWSSHLGNGERRGQLRKARRVRPGPRLRAHRLSQAVHQHHARSDRARCRCARLFCLVAARQFRMGCWLCRLGLVFVDYPTQRRILKASARWYWQLIDQESALATVAA